LFVYLGQILLRLPTPLIRKIDKKLNKFINKLKSIIHKLKIASTVTGIILTFLTNLNLSNKLCIFNIVLIIIFNLFLY